MERLVLIDGPSLLHRAYHALPPLTNSRGEQTGAVFGFTSMFLKVIEELKPQYVVCAWDTAAPTFRDQIYTQYKAQRPPLDKDFITQEPNAHQVLEAFVAPQYAIDGYEADDIIGTIVERVSNLGDLDDLETIIVTGDMDSTQLVDNKTKVFTSRKGFSDTVLMGEAEVEAKFGLKPGQIIDYKALRGDPSDNIPGVRGVGEKTAVELLQKFGNLESTFQHLSNLTERQQKLLSEGQESAFMSQRLATIKRDVPLQFDLKEAVFGQYDNQTVLDLFQLLGFRTLIRRLPGQFQKKENDFKQEGLGLTQSRVDKIEEAQLNIESKTIEDRTGFLAFKEVALKEKILTLDTETNTYQAFVARLEGIGVGSGDSFGYLPFEWLKKEGLSFLKDLLENGTILKIGHNLKFDAQVLLNYDIQTAPFFFDTMLAAYLLRAGQGRLGLKDLAFSELGIVMEDLKQVSSKFKPLSRVQIEGVQGSKLKGNKDNMTSNIVSDVWAGVPVEEIAKYCINDVRSTQLLFQKYQKELEGEEKLKKLFYEVEMPLSFILTQMERNGILVDRNYLSNLNVQLSIEVANLEKEIYQCIGHEFNINSPKQLEAILFDELHLPPFGKTKGKTHRSTDESVLRKLKGLHPVVPLLLSYREAFKIQTTYTTPLRDLADGDSRIHTSFNQTRASTGRLSSEEPNLQNIPVESKWNLRKAFVAKEGHKILVADYSQIELRVMAHFSKDPALVNSFEHNQDIHTATAARIFNKFIQDVNPVERRIAKTVNFAVLYGQTAYGLSDLLEIEQAKAQIFIDDYFESYPKVKEWISDNLTKAYDRGYVESLLGRKRLIPELKASSFMIRQSGERMATNMPIQATAADLIKMAMVNISFKLKTSKLKFSETRMLLQVHDELVFEVPEGKVEEAARMVEEEMEKALKLSVPIKVDLKIGDNWGELEKI